MREVHGPDSLFVIHASVFNENSDEVIRSIKDAFPESVAIEAINEGAEQTSITAFCREYALVTELIELHKDGKVVCFEVK